MRDSLPRTSAQPAGSPGLTTTTTPRADLPPPGQDADDRPKGLAFDLADLVHARGWAIAHDLRMNIRLDHGAEDEEYEEVIELHAGPQARSRILVWRDADTVFVQPLLGRRQSYRTLRDALRGLLPSQRAAAAMAGATAPASWTL